MKHVVSYKSLPLHSPPQIEGPFIAWNFLGRREIFQLDFDVKRNYKMFLPFCLATLCLYLEVRQVGFPSLHIDWITKCLLQFYRTIHNRCLKFWPGS